MKVTAILPDELVKDVQEFSSGKNITDSLIKALTDWLYMKRIQKLNNQLKNSPIEFADGFTAESIREINRAI